MNYDELRARWAAEPRQHGNVEAAVDDWLGEVAYAVERSGRTADPAGVALAQVRVYIEELSDLIAEVYSDETERLEAELLAARFIAGGAHAGTIQAAQDAGYLGALIDGGALPTDVAEEVRAIAVRLRGAGQRGVEDPVEHARRRVG